MQGWDGWKYKTQSKPWEINDAEREQIATQIAFNMATDKVVDKLIARYWLSKGERSVFFPEPEYIDDVIGRDDASARIHQARMYGLYRNFFISLDSAESSFPLTLETDAICRACIGDGSGVGSHCRAFIPTEENKDLIIIKNLKLLDETLVEMTGGELSVKARAFFDQDFFRLVTPGI